MCPCLRDSIQPRHLLPMLPGLGRNGNMVAFDEQEPEEHTTSPAPTPAEAHQPPNHWNHALTRELPKDPALPRHHQNTVAQPHPTTEPSILPHQPSHQPQLQGPAQGALPHDQHPTSPTNPWVQHHPGPTAPPLPEHHTTFDTMQSQRASSQAKPTNPTPKP